MNSLKKILEENSSPNYRLEDSEQNRNPITTFAKEMLIPGATYKRISSQVRDGVYNRPRTAKTLGVMIETIKISLETTGILASAFTLYKAGEHILYQLS